MNKARRAAIYAAIADAIVYYSARHDLAWAKFKFWGTTLPSLSSKVYDDLVDALPLEDVAAMDMKQLVDWATAQGSRHNLAPFKYRTIKKHSK